MRLTVNGKAFEIDRAELEENLTAQGLKKLEEVQAQAPAGLHMIVNSAISAVFAFLGRKHPELRKPDDVPAIPFAAETVARLLLDEWEKNGLTVTAKEVIEDAAQKV